MGNVECSTGQAARSVVLVCDASKPGATVLPWWAGMLEMPITMRRIAVRRRRAVTAANTGARRPINSVSRMRSCIVDRASVDIGDMDRSSRLELLGWPRIASCDGRPFRLIVGAFG
jgi:hypothetical protein